MKYKLPIIVPYNLKPVVTQPYGDLANLQFYKDKGINIPFHNGLDIAMTGEDIRTYGCSVITPSPDWKLFRKYMYSSVGANGNSVVIHSKPFEEDGITKVIELRFVHLSQINESLNEGDILPGNTVLGYIGNSGFVTPAPTPDCPFEGSHLHIGMFEYHIIDGAMVNPNIKNGVYGLIDPQTRIDVNDYNMGEEDYLKDIPAFLWAFEKLGLTTALQKLFYVLKVFKNWKIK